MSEITAISNQYNKVVDTTDKVNNSIITLKKISITNSTSRKDDKFIISLEELAIAKNYLLKFLYFLESMNRQEVMDYEFLPKTVIKDFKKRINQVPFFESQVHGLIENIKNDNMLTTEQFNLLDNMASTLDSERTVLFRKLRTARG